MTAPALVVAIPVLLGVLAGSSLVTAPRGTGAALVLLWIACGTATFAPIRLSARARGIVVAVLAAAGCAAAGVLLGAAAARAAAQPSLVAWWQAHGQDRSVHLTGVVRDDAASAGTAVGLTLDVIAADGQRVDGGVRVSIAGGLAADAARDWRAGRTLALDALLREPQDYRDPGVASDRARL